MLWPMGSQDYQWILKQVGKEVTSWIKEEISLIIAPSGLFYSKKQNKTNSQKLKG